MQAEHDHKATGADQAVNLVELLTQDCAHCKREREALPQLTELFRKLHLKVRVREHIQGSGTKDTTGDPIDAKPEMCTHCYGTGRSLTKQGNQLLWFLKTFWAEDPVPVPPAEEIPF